MTSRIKAAVAASLTGVLALSACSAASGGEDGADQLSVVGFSVLEAANEPVFAEFEGNDAGEGVTFKTSYGASGDQSRAVEGGLDADVVHFSLEPDMQRLVDAGLVADSWKDNVRWARRTSWSRRSPVRALASTVLRSRAVRENSAATKIAVPAVSRTIARIESSEKTRSMLIGSSPAGRRAAGPAD